MATTRAVRLLVAAVVAVGVVAVAGLLAGLKVIAGIATGVPIGALRDFDETPIGPPRDWLDRLSSVQPRAAAVAVMGLLAFGALVGSSVGSVAQSATGGPIFVSVSVPATQTSKATSGTSASPRLARLCAATPPTSSPDNLT